MTNRNWKKTLIKSNRNIRDAIKTLEIAELQVLLVVDDNNKFKGTVTDGDIRRGLIKGLTLETKIFEIMNTNSVLAPPDTDEETAKQLMVTNSIMQLPIVDKKRNIKDLFLLSEYLSVKKRSNPFIIMAGGKGLRLRPLTKKTPKPMLKVNGKPILEWIIINAKKQGFNNFYLITNYLSKVIEDYFKNGKKFGVKIKVIKEDQFLGTIGGLYFAKKFIKENFILTNGDIVSDIKYDEVLEFHDNLNSDATLAVNPYYQKISFGVIKTDGIKVKEITEKPIEKKYINAGVYVFKKEILKYIKKKEYLDVTNFINNLIMNKKKINAFALHENWNDIGIRENLEKLKKSQ